MNVGFIPILIGFLTASGCDSLQASEQMPTPSPVTFRTVVYPILLRDCSFAGCHANSERPFQVFGPGRVRLDSESDIFDPPTELEFERAYWRTCSMLLYRDDPFESLMLAKPLDGVRHGGEDDLGRNLYRDRSDRSLSLIMQWLRDELES